MKLYQHGRQWAVRLKIPESIRHRFPNKNGGYKWHEFVWLGTNRQAAERGKYLAVAKLKAQFEVAKTPLSVDRQIEALAMEGRSSARGWLNALFLMQEEQRPKLGQTREDLEREQKARQLKFVTQLVTAQYDGEPRERSDDTKEFSRILDIADGLATPIFHYLEEWLTQEKCTRRTELKRRQSVRWFVEWLGQKGLPATIEVVDRAVAGKFYRQKLLSEKHSHAVSVGIIHGLRSYWAWLFNNGVTEAENPWESIRVKKSAGGSLNAPRRAFTDEEVTRLFKGSGSPRAKRLHASLVDAMWIALLTGARGGSIYGLRVRDVLFDQSKIDDLADRTRTPRGVCPSGAFYFKPRKSEKHGRLVPMHPLLVQRVKRLMESKSLDGYLLPAKKLRSRRLDESERHRPWLEDFEVYRQLVGVHDKAQGERESQVVFHSFRHWFDTRALIASEHSGGTFSYFTVQDLMGHAPSALRMTRGVYGVFTGMDARVACVNAVQPPVPIREAEEARAASKPL